MHSKTPLTMWVLIHVCAGFLFPKVYSGEINVALGASCSASTEHASDTAPCEQAIDGDISSAYASMKEGVGMWYRLDFDRFYEVKRLNIMDRAFPGEKNKDLKLTFSDGSFQKVTFPTPEEGPHWTDFPVTPVLTNSLIIEVISVYTKLNNGFVEIEVFVDEPDIPIPTVPAESCRPHEIRGTYPPSEDKWALNNENKQCVLRCMKTSGCVAVLIHIHGGTCTQIHTETDADQAQIGPGYSMWRRSHQKSSPQG